MTANKVSTVIPNSLSTTTYADYIEPGKHRILSIEVTGTPAPASGTLGIPPGSTATEAVCSIYDSSTIGGATNRWIEGELESTDSDTVKKTYTRPLDLVNGVVVVQGAWTVVSIEYERTQP